MALEETISKRSAPASDAEDTNEARHLRVFFVGHSLGGMVAVQTALVAAAHCASTLFSGAKAEVVGFCTLNGAIDYRVATEYEDDFRALQNARALLIAGDKDAVVPPDATEMFYEALPMREKRHLVLAGGEHDLSTCKQRLLTELEEFLTS